MGVRYRIATTLAVAMFLGFAPLMAMSQSGEHELGHPQFVEVWDRTDLPVQQGEVQRTWMWGPGANTQLMEEEYAEAADGTRTVQYTDKSRMELVVGAVPPDSDWAITQGLLATELMTGNLQLGDNTFEQHDPADIYVAGDPENNESPTYAQMGELIDRDPRPTGEIITEILTPEGEIADDYHLDVHGVTDAYYIEQTDKNIASVFWAFMNSSGTIYEGGQFVEGDVFTNPFYAIGFPVTDAYWGHVTVDGDPQNVLMQCFERRCLTYAPHNDPGWQVESGNIGQHYYDWRYQEIDRPADDTIADDAADDTTPGTDDDGVTDDSDDAVTDDDDTIVDEGCVSPGQSIQDAIDAAQPGDEVCVESGIYEEGLSITTDDLTISGGSDVVLDGRNLDESDIGLDIESTSGVRVSSVRIQEFYFIRVLQSEQIEFEDIHSSHSGGSGVHIEESSYVEFADSTFGIGSTGEHTLVGFDVEQSEDVMIRDSDVAGDIRTTESSNVFVRNSQIDGNVSFGRPDGAGRFTPSTGTMINSTLADGTVQIRNVEELLVENNTFTDGGSIRSVEHDADYVTIGENTFTDDSGGLEIVGIDTVAINANNFYGQSSALAIRVDGDNPMILGNEINGSRSSAVRVTGDNASIAGNVIQSATNSGIRVTGQSASVTDNVVSDAGEHGIWIDGESATIQGNVIERTGETGIEILGNAEAAANLIDDINGPGIHLPGDSASAEITNNRITRTETAILTGDETNGALTTATHNDILKNDTGIRVNNAPSGSYLNARHNYWGSDDGPSGEGPGSGDSVEGPVNIDYWEDELINPDLEP